MALEEFEKEQLSDRDKGYIRMRSMMDFGMGTLWAAMGFFLIFYLKKVNPSIVEQFGSGAFKAFGVLCIIYGLFRIWRGYKKNYYRNR